MSNKLRWLVAMRARAMRRSALTESAGVRSSAISAGERPSG